MQEGPAQAEVAPPSARAGRRGSRGRGQLGEVAVVAGGLDRRAERRVDEAVRLPRGAERELDHLGERRRDLDDAAATRG